MAWKLTGELGWWDGMMGRFEEDFQSMGFCFFFVGTKITDLGIGAKVKHG
jgi:hypothetical protein